MLRFPFKSLFTYNSIVCFRYHHTHPHYCVYYKTMFINLLAWICLVLTWNIYFTNGMKSLEYNQTSSSCGYTVSLQQIMQLLKEQPCVKIIEQDGHRIVKRNTDAGNVDIHALQTTINDHRTMINYLINNSINASFVSDAILDHHSKTGPIFSSWRDLTDVFTISLLFGFVIYYCICRTGFRPCDKIIAFFCQPIITRTTQQQDPRATVATIATTMSNEASFRKPSQRRAPPTSTASFVDGDIVRFNHGYISE
jgi:hypothetical protein